MKDAKSLEKVLNEERKASVELLKEIEELNISHDIVEGIKNAIFILQGFNQYDIIAMYIMYRLDKCIDCALKEGDKNE